VTDHDMAVAPTAPASQTPLTIDTPQGAPVALTELPGLKAGWRTSEFWVTLVALAMAAALMYRGRDELATVVLSVATGGYHASRAIVKAKAAA
jgi:hypothetical protein